VKNILRTAWKSKLARSYRMGRTVSIFILAIVMAGFISKRADAAEESISVKEINYLNSTITLQLNDGDTKVYFSDSTRKTWEEVPGDISSSKTITMDISWISLAKNYVMTFKANKSTGIISVTIPKQATNFKVTYNKAKGTVSFKNEGTRTIEWRKENSTTWNTVNMNTISTDLGYLCNNGATVYFRLGSTNGSGVTYVGSRVSKEVKITIPKKTTAPSASVDGSAFSISVKKRMAYRTVNSNGSTSEWTSINSSTSLLLKNVAANAMYSDAATSRKKVTLQFRTNATSATQVSNIATVTIPAQEGPPSESAFGISITYTSASTLALQVKSASIKIPFEYIIIDSENTLDYQTAKWTTISSSTAVDINDRTAKTGSHIYVRKKSIAATDTTDFALASKEIDISGTAGVTYPEGIKTSLVTTLVSLAGVCRTDKISSYLTFNLYSPTSATVSSINFLDAYGISKGTVTCKSTVAKNYGGTGTNDKYIITTKITSTANLDKVTEEMLYADITLSNSDTITSTSAAGVLLYLYPATVLNNPVNEKDYTNSFNRVYMSNEEEDKSKFKFKLDFGTANVINTTAVNSYTTTATAIQTIKYDGYTLSKDTDYTVEYGSYVNDKDKTIATATVTVNVANVEKSSLISKTDEALPFVITLNNNEILDDDVYMKLISTATMKDIPIAWSITEGSLKETQTSTVTNPDKTTTTVTEEVISFSITLNIFDKAYGVGVSDVTWGGTSIFGSAIISNGTATIYLSNAKINKLTTDSTDTKNVVIALSNGFVIKSGCKLTILRKS